MRKTGQATACRGSPEAAELSPESRELRRRQWRMWGGEIGILILSPAPARLAAGDAPWDTDVVWRGEGLPVVRLSWTRATEKDLWQPGAYLDQGCSVHPARGPDFALWKFSFIFCKLCQNMATGARMWQCVHNNKELLNHWTAHWIREVLQSLEWISILLGTCIILQKKPAQVEKFRMPKALLLSE